MCHLMCPQITQKCLQVKLLFNLLLHSTAKRIVQQKPTHTLNLKSKIKKQRRSKLAHWQPQRMLEVFTSSNDISFSLNLWKNSKCLIHPDTKKVRSTFIHKSQENVLGLTLQKKEASDLGMTWFSLWHKITCQTIISRKAFGPRAVYLVHVLRDATKLLTYHLKQFANFFRFFS